MAFQLDRNFQYEPNDRLSATSWAPVGFLIGSGQTGVAAALDGVLQIGNATTSFGTIKAYGAVAGVPGYFNLIVDSAATYFNIAGSSVILLSGTGFNPSTTNTMTIGNYYNRFASVTATDVRAPNSLTMGGTHSVGGTAARGYLIGNTASDTAATRTGSLAFYGQNNTLYATLGDGLAKLNLAFVGGGYLDVSMASNTALPMFRLTRSDNSNNHIEMLASNTTTAKAHLGAYAGNAYIAAGSYFNGTSWTQDNSGTSAARIEVITASADSHIDFYTHNANNIPAATFQMTLDKIGNLDLMGNGRLGLCIGGVIKAIKQVVYRGSLANGATANIPGSSWGVVIFRIQNTGQPPYYNTAVVLTGHDQYNGSVPVILGQTAVGYIHQLYIGGATGLRYNQPGGGAAPTLYNGSGHTLEICVEVDAIYY